MANQKTKKSSLLARIRNHKIITVFTVLAVVVLGALIYQKASLEQNRHSFQQARSSIDAIYAEIVTRVGKPDNYRRSNSCSRSYVENPFSSGGPITCDISTEFVYGVTDLSEANTMFKAIQSVLDLNNNGLSLTASPSSGISSHSDGINSYQTTDDLYKFAGLRCDSYYVFDSLEHSALRLLNSPSSIGKKTLYIDISCSGSAKELFFTSK